MKDRSIKLEASFEGANTLKSGDLSLRFHTQELTPEEKVIVMEYVNTFGWLLFKANEFQQDDIPKEEAEADLSPSQELRRTLYVYWEKLGKPNDDFQIFYRQQIKRLKSKYLEKIEDLDE